jgi:hypothetical protein
MFSELLTVDVETIMPAFPLGIELCIKLPFARVAVALQDALSQRAVQEVLDAIKHISVGGCHCDNKPIIAELKRTESGLETLKKQVAELVKNLVSRGHARYL